MLLLQLFYLLQGEEGAPAGGGLLRVAPSPLLKAVCMSASHMQAQVLLVPSAEVAVLTGEGLGPCGYGDTCTHAALQGTLNSLYKSLPCLDKHCCPVQWTKAERTFSRSPPISLFPN